MLRAACIKHVPFEGPGHVEDWLSKNNIPLDIYEVYETKEFPSPDVYDILIIMGGPMSVNDEDIDFIKKESDFLKKNIHHFNKVIGFCLGAQFIAKSLDSKIYQGEKKEIGWYEVSSKSEKFNNIPAQFTSFHWHGETFDLPENAELIFSSQSTPNQGFVYKNCLAFQFHPEIKEESIAKLAQHCANELEEEGEFIMSYEEMKDQTELIKSNNNIIGTVLDQFILHQ